MYGFCGWYLFLKKLLEKVSASVNSIFVYILILSKECLKYNFSSVAVVNFLATKTSAHGTGQIHSWRLVHVQMVLVLKLRFKFRLRFNWPGSNLSLLLTYHVSWAVWPLCVWPQSPHQRHGDNYSACLVSWFWGLNEQDMQHHDKHLSF